MFGSGHCATYSIQEDRSCSSGATAASSESIEEHLHDHEQHGNRGEEEGRGDGVKMQRGGSGRTTEGWRPCAGSDAQQYEGERNAVPKRVDR